MNAKVRWRQPYLYTCPYINIDIHVPSVRMSTTYTHLLHVEKTRVYDTVQGGGKHAVYLRCSSSTSVHPLFQAPSARLGRTVRRHKFNQNIPFVLKTALDIRLRSGVIRATKCVSLVLTTALGTQTRLGAPGASFLLHYPPTS